MPRKHVRLVEGLGRVQWNKWTDGLLGWDMGLFNRVYHFNCVNLYFNSLGR